ncbi:MAG: NUMOD3 domain-containing DNA-binding protein [Acinetobacter sp.]|uniref:NUMOD3 domain-containing DNA-binding protein n=1 Tax=Acinetobacter sp. TaxID=472 RepID=UPI003918EFDD
MTLFIRHYTYLTVNNHPDADPKYYIGCRTAKGCSPEEDDYLGSSKTLKADIENFGKEYFTKMVFTTFETREDAYKLEIYLHNLFDVGASKLFINKAKQTSTGFTTHGLKASDDHRMKNAEAQRGKKHTQETREKMSVIQKGRIVTKETRKILSLINQGKKASNSTLEKLSIAHKGRKHSAEHVEKQAAAQRGKTVSEESRARMSAAQKLRFQKVREAKLNQAE